MAKIPACIATLAMVSAAAATGQLPVDSATRGPTDTVSSKDVTRPSGKTRTIDFTTTEGTNMSVDVTPDGRWVVFDLLSHIYRVPMAGGEAEVLTQGSGIALNYQPRVSPDGKAIAFISDRTGQSNLWVMDIDGRNPRPVARTLASPFTEPVWTPDGEFIMARVGGAIRKYPKGGGAGVDVIRGASNVAASPDGKYLYFQANVTTETRTGVVGNRDLLMGGIQIRRFTLATRDTFDVTSGTDEQNGGRNSSGGAIAPEVSPDGRWLSFARRIPNGTISHKGKKLGPRNTLWLHDLETGAERMVMDPVETDAAEGVKTARTMAAYKWMSDGKSIVLAQGGRIRKLDVATGAVTTIPFRARVHREISEQAIPVTRITDEPFQAKYLLWHTASPDGSTLAFQAAGRIYVQALPNGTPRRVTPADFKPLEYAPSWSPDGQWLAFASWDGIEPGYIWKVSPRGGAPVKITREAAEYTHPSWSADGSEIVATRGSGVTFQGRPLSANPWYEIVRVPAAGGRATAVVRVLPFTGREQLPRATFGPEGRIYYVTRVAGAQGQPASRELVSVKPDGGDKRVHAAFPFTDDAVPSPDGRWVAYNEGDNIFVTAMPNVKAAEKPARTDRRRDSTAIRMLGTDGGLYPRWRNATTVEFGSANVYSAYDVNGEQRTRATVELRIPKDIPRGTIALTNARIITMKGREVIARGTIVITGSRIQCVGTCSTQGADRVVDLTGKTVFPGWVDMHAHRMSYSDGLIAPRNFEAASALAYGITTDHDPAAWSQVLFATAEMTEAGEVIGPRAFGSGESVSSGTGARGNPMERYDDLERIAAKLKSWGAVSLKGHPLPRRDQRQWWSRGRAEARDDGDLRGRAPRSGAGLHHGWANRVGASAQLHADLQRRGAVRRRGERVLLVDNGGRWSGHLERGVLLPGNGSLEGREASALGALAVPRPAHSAPHDATGDGLQLPDRVPGSCRRRRRRWLRAHGPAQPAERALGALGSAHARGGPGRPRRARGGERARREVPGRVAGPGLARGGEARRPDRHELEPAQRHPQYRRHAVRDEGRRSLRLEHARRAVAAAAEFGSYPWMNRDVYRDDDRPTNYFDRRQ